MTDERRRPISVFREFLDGEAAGGIVLIAAAALALVVANSPAAAAYFRLLHTPLASLDVLHWINDGLMAVFFLFVGLEIKREFLDGQLRSWSDRALPGIAAAGGVAVPAAIYAALNGGSPETLPKSLKRSTSVDCSRSAGLASSINLILRAPSSGVSASIRRCASNVAGSASSMCALDSRCHNS